jgi:hypothetical protein
MRENNRRGGAIASILLIILVLGIMGIMALVSTSLYVADHVRVTDRDSRGVTTVETPFGSVRVRENERLNPEQLGMPIYPGAVREHNSHKLASFHFDFGRHHKDFAVGAAAYRTSDSVERVTSFYRDKLPHWLISQKDNGRVELSFTKGGYKRFVAICDDGDQTRIALASVGEPASN